MKKAITLFMAILVLMLPICFADQISLTYDPNGNFVTGDGFYREYNSLNQFWKVYNGSNSSGALLQEYKMHPLEERVMLKQTFHPNGSVKESTYYFTENFVRVINSSGTYNITYVYFNGQLVAQEINGVKHFIHSDHLNSVSVTTNENGSIIENNSYSPFGEVLSGGDTVKLGYEAKEHDSVVGDTDFHFRKYKAEWALFLQPDTLIPELYNPQILNRYMFEIGNPLKYEDKDGHIACGGVCVGILVGMTIGFLTSASTDMAIQSVTEEKIDYNQVAKEGIKGGALGAMFGGIGGYAISVGRTITAATWSGLGFYISQIDYINKVAQIAKDSTQVKTEKLDYIPDKSNDNKKRSQKTHSYEVTKGDGTTVMRTYDPVNKWYNDKIIKKE